MPRKQEKELPFDERITGAIQALEAFGGENALYDRDALLGAHNSVTNLADEGFRIGTFDQPKSIETKLEATRLAGEIAHNQGDRVTAFALDQLAQTLDTLHSVLQQPEPEEPKPARTTRASTGAAKSP